VELISNPMELRAFERMEEDIRLIGYFKGEDSCESVYAKACIMRWPVHMSQTSELCDELMGVRNCLLL
jgi:hypothetical protein